MHALILIASLALSTQAPAGEPQLPPAQAGAEDEFRIRKLSEEDERSEWSAAQSHARAVEACREAVCWTMRGFLGTGTGRRATPLRSPQPAAAAATTAKIEKTKP